MTKCIDNRTERIGDALKASIHKGSKMSIMTAYFTIYAFDKLRKELRSVDNIRFILTDPTIIGDVPKDSRREYFINRKGDETTASPLSGTEWEIKLRNELTQTAIAKECAKWIKEKAEVRAAHQVGQIDSRFIGITGPNHTGQAFQGLSDFTAQSLGYAQSNKIQMVVSIDNYVQTRELLKQFDEVWGNPTLVHDVKKRVLAMLETMYKENPPELIYFITLFNIFREYVEELGEEEIIKTKTGFKETAIWKKLYKYQQDGVVGTIEKVERYNGCILADSVGLGKTFEALAVIKYYELRNYRILVLCPKRLRDNWTIWTRNDRCNPFVDDRFRFDVLHHTDLSRTKGRSGDIDLSTLNWGNYDLVVIDESHNFRNNPKDEDHLSRYQRLMDDIIKNGVRTRVLMLSATPLNTRMSDLRNQIALMTREEDNALEPSGIYSIKQTLQIAQKVFNEWAKSPPSERKVESLLDNLHIDYFKLLDLVTIARSRRHIQKYYGMDEIGKFPRRLPPINEYPEIDLGGKMRPLKDIVEDIQSLSLAAYSPLKFVYPHKLAEYAEKYDYKGKGESVLRQSDRERNILRLMRSIMLKRLESSVCSFSLTLSRMIGKYDVILAKIDKHELQGTLEFDYNNTEDTDEDDEEGVVGGKVKIRLADIDMVKWREELDYDRSRLDKLREEAAQIDTERDAKLQQLKEVIRTKIGAPINPNSNKILIFTTFADTAEYLYSNLSEWLKDELNLYSGVLTGGGHVNKTNLPRCTKDFSTILVNFSPRSKERAKIMSDMKEEIDVLIGTDCISEGQNLQDCDTVINYDIHWNPVRIIQRFGRIDRLGSTNDKIQLINFWPCKNLDEYINLISRVEARMVMGDTAATGDEVISDQDGRELQFRKQQLEQLRERVLDLEEMNGSLTITDLTFNDFKMDLATYIQDSENLKKLKTAPLGMYSIARIEGSGLESELAPGIIFVIRQHFHRAKVKEQNSLHPYYLVYIQQDGQVKHGYSAVKHTLDIFKKLSTGQKEVHADLVKLFDKETHDGTHMEQYSQLLNKAVENVVERKQMDGAASLFGLGESNLGKDAKSSDDFELIAFLLVM